ncbi:endocuticle structural glycoprotein SgAbd-3 [Zeugodacus cucurbitae]|uniref:Endocuticle structural glycoprotein SgAbd-3 n=1 Tax=Zeugodacus cucurbitae TaxID=28588 RepID=A0A0A1X5S3_ZEUCU|nr:endocuticle structural glycoprotein SgAbd-3 [Zeugodacus cucurbitae]
MKLLLVVCLCFASALAKEEVKLISNEAMVEYDGKFHYHYELGDGSKASQDGFLKKVDTEHEGESIEGKFAFVADDGKEYLVTYIADENGYQPQGEHLPTPPPVPESVLKTLKYLEEHPYNPEAAAKKH